MKLSSYYKAQGQVVKLIQYPDECRDMEKIYLRAEHSNSCLLDQEFYSHRDISLGGSYYTNGKYRPFANAEIENAKPDVWLYSEFLSKTAATSKLNIDKLVSSNFIRFNSPAMGHTKYYNQKSNIIVYDQDLVESGNVTRLQELSYWSPGKIELQHSLHIRSYTDFDVTMRTLMQYSKNKFKADKLKLRFEWPRTTYDFKKFMRQQEERLAWLPLSSFQMPLVIDNFEKMEYNINEGLEKYAMLKATGRRPVLYYAPNRANPYDEFCRYIVFNSWKDVQRYNPLIWAAEKRHTKDEKGKLCGQCLPRLIQACPQITRWLYGERFTLQEVGLL